MIILKNEDAPFVLYLVEYSIYLVHIRTLFHHKWRTFPQNKIKTHTFVRGRRPDGQTRIYVSGRRPDTSIQLEWNKLNVIVYYNTRSTAVCSLERCPFKQALSLRRMFSVFGIERLKFSETGIGHETANGVLAGGHQKVRSSHPFTQTHIPQRPHTHKAFLWYGPHTFTGHSFSLHFRFFFSSFAQNKIFQPWRWCNDWTSSKIPRKSEGAGRLRTIWEFPPKWSGQLNRKPNRR